MCVFRRRHGAHGAAGSALNAGVMGTAEAPGRLMVGPDTQRHPDRNNGSRCEGTNVNTYLEALAGTGECCSWGNEHRFIDL